MINHAERIHEGCAGGPGRKRKILTLPARSGLMNALWGGVEANRVSHSLPFTQYPAATFPMRLRFKGSIVRLFVVVILLSSLACSELPELERLIDNTSNDFTPPSYVVGEITSAVSSQLTPESPMRALHVAPQQNSSDVPQHIGAFLSSRDLLHLFSIIRT
jgi:hypothetical protein